MSPCCVVYKKNRDFGQLDDAPIDVGALWNNEKYQSARSLFSAKVIDQRRPTVCDTCDIFAYHPSKVRPPRPVKGQPIEIHRRKS